MWLGITLGALGAMAAWTMRREIGGLFRRRQANEGDAPPRRLPWFAIAVVALLAAFGGWLIGRAQSKAPDERIVDEPFVDRRDDDIARKALDRANQAYDLAERAMRAAESAESR